MSASRVPPAADLRAEAASAARLRVSPERAGYLRRALYLTAFTVGWNVLEGLVAIGAGVAAGSIALVGFGVDSFMRCSRAS